MRQPPPDAVPGLDDTALHRLADEALAGRDGPGVWVFAYGSLIWEDCFRCDVAYPAELDGFSRAYCIWDERNRGTPQQRALTLGLVPGGRCTGLAMHIREADLEAEFPKVWNHEMRGGYYRADWVVADARKHGPVRALTFVADGAHPLFAGDVPDAAAAVLLAARSGSGGTAREYLERTAAALRAAAVPDTRLDALAQAVGLADAA